MRQGKLGRILTLAAVITIVLSVTASRPARAAYTWYGADMGRNDWSFRRTLTGDPNAAPIMTAQTLCMLCVPTAEQAWIDYFFIYHYGDFGHGRDSGFNQTYYWNNDLNVARTWSYVRDYPGASTSAFCPNAGTYPRRLSNISQDDGVDPYGMAWAMYARVGTYVSGYYFHEISYDDGATSAGWSTATHGLAWTLATYKDPVGVLVDSGGHMVLGIGAETDPAPTTNFWAPIQTLTVRDPQYSEVNDQNYLTYRVQVFDMADSWNLRFTRYGYNITLNPTTETATLPPNHGADDPRVGPNAAYRPTTLGQHGVWWGQYVLVKRDDIASNPDQHLSYAP